MNELEPLVIGDLVVEKPITQGGMGVDISLHKLVGAVAKAGGADVISVTQISSRESNFTTNFMEANLRSIRRGMKLAGKITLQDTIGLGIMVATEHYDIRIKETVKASVDIIISGVELSVPLPECVEAAYAEMEKKPNHRTKLVPIVSSAKSAMVICKTWGGKCHIASSPVVVEGPLAGDHLGFSLDQSSAYGADTSDVPTTYDQEAYGREIGAAIKVVEEYGTKYDRHIPMTTAGGICTHEDMMHQLELGADGVQVTARLVATQECDISNAYKQTYMNTGKEDIVIIQNPVNIPGKAVLSLFSNQIKGSIGPVIKSCFQCLEYCDIRAVPYCTAMALVYAARGGTDYGLLFRGSNAHCAGKVDTMDNVIKESAGELA